MHPILAVRTSGSVALFVGFDAAKIQENVDRVVQRFSAGCGFGDTQFPPPPPIDALVLVFERQTHTHCHEEDGTVERNCRSSGRPGLAHRMGLASGGRRPSFWSF